MTAKQRRIYIDIFNQMKKSYKLANEKPTESQKEFIISVVNYICSNFTTKSKKTKYFTEDPLFPEFMLGNNEKDL